MEQTQMSKFCIELKGMMLPDAIAAVVEAWYEAQNLNFDYSRKFYTVQELQKVLDKSRASVYRILNNDKNVLNPPFDPQKLNHEYRANEFDPIQVSAAEITRWKEESRKARKLVAQQNAKARAFEKSIAN
jgi:hypothetical protein